jgi:hypothetical protein
MTVLAPRHLPLLQERRHHTQDRQRVVGISTIWGVLTLLAAAAAMLQTDDSASLHPPAPAPLPVSALQAMAPGTVPDSWIGVVPNVPDSVDPPAPSF